MACCGGCVLYDVCVLIAGHQEPGKKPGGRHGMVFGHVSPAAAVAPQPATHTSPLPGEPRVATAVTTLACVGAPLAAWLQLGRRAGREGQDSGQPGTSCNTKIRAMFRYKDHLCIDSTKDFYYKEKTLGVPILVRQHQYRDGGHPGSHFNIKNSTPYRVSPLKIRGSLIFIIGNFDTGYYIETPICALFHCKDCLPGIGILITV